MTINYGRKRQYPDPSRGDTDILSLVLAVDPDWARDSFYPLSYRFDNGRIFRNYEAPNETYAWVADGIFARGISVSGVDDQVIATEDGLIIQVEPTG